MIQSSYTSRGILEYGDTEGGAGIVDATCRRFMIEASTDDYWVTVMYSHWPDSELILASIAGHRSGGRGFNIATNVLRPLMRALYERQSSVENREMDRGVVVGTEALDEKILQVPAEAFLHNLVWSIRFLVPLYLCRLTLTLRRRQPTEASYQRFSSSLLLAPSPEPTLEALPPCPLVWCSILFRFEHSQTAKRPSDSETQRCLQAPLLLCKCHCCSLHFHVALSRGSFFLLSSSSSSSTNILRKSIEASSRQLPPNQLPCTNLRPQPPARASTRPLVSHYSATPHRDLRPLQPKRATDPACLHLERSQCRFSAA